MINRILFITPPITEMEVRYATNAGATVKP